MCYINNALDVKRKCRTKVRLNNLYLNRYYGKKNVNKQLWICSYQFQVFWTTKISQAIWARLIYKDYYLSSSFMLLRNENVETFIIPLFVEFDPGSGQTLAACFKHASRTEVRFSTEHFYMRCSVENLPLVADGWVTRE